MRAPAAETPAAPYEGRRERIMTEIICAAIGSGALSAVISGIFQLAGGRQRRGQGLTAGMRALLHDRIKSLGLAYIEAGQVVSGDLEDLMEMHRIYHDELGGNGYLDQIMEAVKRLPQV